MESIQLYGQNNTGVSSRPTNVCWRSPPSLDEGLQKNQTIIWSLSLVSRRCPYHRCIECSEQDVEKKNNLDEGLHEERLQKHPLQMLPKAPQVTT